MRSKFSGQILALTGLRYFAAALVVVFHFSRSSLSILKGFVDHGGFGVVIFFVLSGFILAYSYNAGVGKIRGTKLAFWGARVARLYPTYVVGIILMAPVVLVRSTEPAWQQLASGVLSFALIQSWFNSLGTSWGMWNPPGWSLSAEAFFYLLFPAIYVTLSKLSTMRLAVFAIVCWGIGVLSVFTQVVVGLAAGDLWGYIPLVRLPEFLIGVVAGLIWERRNSLAFDRAAPWITILSAGAILFVMFLPLGSRWYGSATFAPLVAVFICALACDRGPIAKILSRRPLVELGKASFSLYILHWPVWMIVNEVFGSSALAVRQPNLYFSLYFVLNTCLACICFKYFEEPLNRILRQKLAKSAPVPRHAGSDVSQHEGLPVSMTMN